MINLKIVATVVSIGLAALGTDTYVTQQDINKAHQDAVAKIIEIQERENSRRTAFMEGDEFEIGEIELDYSDTPEYTPYLDYYIPVQDEESSFSFENYHPTMQDNGPEHLLPAGYRGSAASSAFTFDVTNPSYVTAYELNKALEKTGLAGLGPAYTLAEQKYGVNALFLAAITALESGWGNSPIAKAKNNIGGYGAYDSSPYESAWKFGSREDCILQMAKSISEEYVKPTGAYYKGKTIAAINIHYSSSNTWKTKVFNIIKELQADINKQ